MYSLNSWWYLSESVNLHYKFKQILSGHSQSTMYSTWTKHSLLNMWYGINCCSLTKAVRRPLSYLILLYLVSGGSGVVSLAIVIFILIDAWSWAYLMIFLMKKMNTGPGSLDTDKDDVKTFYWYKIYSYKLKTFYTINF